MPGDMILQDQKRANPDCVERLVRDADNFYVMKEQFLARGFARKEVLIDAGEVVGLRHIYDRLLQDKARTAGLRSDLSGAVPAEGRVEKITQIMRPGLLEPQLYETRAYALALAEARTLLGGDMALDFDMLINKAPNTATETPWHQDAAYWIDMPDKRAVSCWIALDDVFEDNGCMWFIPRNGEQGIVPHKSLPGGGALYCEADAEKAEPVRLSAGGCTFHDGFTLHYSRGNTTQGHRRALIFNFRPETMIKLERDLGVDHTGERKKRQ